MIENPYKLQKGKVLKVKKENYNTVSIWIESSIQPKPGQYVMFYAFGKGEAPITIASYENGISLHTIRIVGDVTSFFVDIKPGDIVYLRGPYGNSWDYEEAHGKDVVIISGGLGLAATRWLMESIIQEKDKFKSVLSIYGSKSYEDLLYTESYETWKSQIDFEIIIGKPTQNWNGRVGLITEIVEEIKKKDTKIFLCGPDPMVKAVVDILLRKDIDKSDIKVSLERHMKCSVGTCGHCMFGPFFVCKDGPVFRYSNIDYFFNKKGV